MLARLVLAASLVMTLSAHLLARSTAGPFDHAYADYAGLLASHVRGARVDYARLKANRAILDQVVMAFGAVEPADEQHWSRDQRLAFWTNAYNLLTVRVIVDHYPIRGRWLSRHPPNSIRQIDGVWTKLTWSAAGRRVTLDNIEHDIIRREFADPRIHFAINCASVSCPPLASEPYRAPTLDHQLDAAARRYLSSPLGLVADRRTLHVSSIFKWYGADFVARFAPLGPSSRSGAERAILGVIRQFGPPDAAALAVNGISIDYLPYDWSLNDTTNESGSKDPPLRASVPEP